MRLFPRLGPLRFLALFMVTSLAIAVSRVPAVIRSIEADLAAFEAWEKAHASATHRLVPLPEREGLGVGLTRTQPSDAATAPDAATMPDHGRHVRVQVASANLRPEPPRSDPIEVPPLAPPVPGGGPAELVIALEAHTPAGFTLAARGYASLATGNRRAAARDLAAALTTAPADPNAPAWRAQLRLLDRRWSGEAYVLLRGSGTPGLGVAPLLGGGQSAARLAWSPDPLMRRPVALTARASIAHDLDRVDTASAQGAVGVQWRLMPSFAVDAERLVAIGDAGRDALTLRASGGVERRIGPLRLEAFAETGVVGVKHRDLFASLQARVGGPITFGKVALEPGLGLWSAVQRSDSTASRVDIGPTLRLRIPHAALALDYRRRVAGNASPGNGAALTLSTGF